MKNLLIFLSLSSLAFSSNELANCQNIVDSFSISYKMNNKESFHREQKCNDKDALTIEKSVIKETQTGEFTFSLILNVNRDVKNVLLSDTLEEGMTLVKGSLLLNEEPITITHEKLSFTLGDVKKGEVYVLTYKATTL